MHNSKSVIVRLLPTVRFWNPISNAENIFLITSFVL